MIPYILHVSILIILCYLVYKILLSKETFYRLNRYVLLFGMVISLSLPLVTIPEGWSLRPLIPWEAWSASFIAPSPKETREEIRLKAPQAENENSQSKKLAAKSKPTTVSEKKASTPLEATAKWNWANLIYYIYWIGTGIFLLNLLIQLITLGIQILRNPRVKDGKYLIVELDNDNAPYSFLNVIFINPEKYDWDTYQQIISHEKVHVHQGHSLDLFFAEILIAFQWFNPIAWYYRRALENNLEYLTDASMLSQGTSRESYQMNLLKVSVPHYPMQITTNYNQSFLKRRIAMMNTKKSSISSVWKYLFLLPLLGLTMMSLNQVEITPVKVVQNISQLVEKSRENAKPLVQEVPRENQKTPEPNSLDNNQENLPSIQIEAWMQGDIKGIWRGDIHGDQLCIAFDHSDRDKGRMWMNTKCFARDAFGTLPFNQEGTFSLTREAGTITLTGKFEAEEGYGKFEFSPNEDFKAFLRKEGVEKSDDYLLFLCFFSEMGKADIRYAKSQYPQISSKQLRKLAIHGLNKAKMESYTTYLSKNGFGKPGVETLVKLEIHDVTPDYIEAMRKAGYKEKRVESYIKASIHDVGPDYGRQFSELGYKNLSLDDLIKFSIHDVNADFVKEMRQLGFDDLSEAELVKASIHDIDTDFVKEMQDLGFKNLSLSQLIKASIHVVYR
ncbi:MAG: M56 family metallopeptidase, partial [Bacteroidota bacterium]